MPISRLDAVAGTPNVFFAGEGDVRPRHFGDAAAERVAATTGCALFDVHDRTQLKLAGADVASFLHNFCTADVNALRPGEGAEAFFPTAKGRILAHAFLLRGEDRFWLSAEPGVAETLVPHLTKYRLTSDVEIKDGTTDWNELLVTGPAAADVIRATTGIDAAALSDRGHEAAAWGENGLIVVRRLPLAAGPCWAVEGKWDVLESAWAAFVGEGAAPAGQDVLDGLRIEAGLPVVGVDVGENNLVQEAARTEHAVSFTKGCYLGQEPIARLDAMGHTNKELRTLLIEGDAPVNEGVVTFEGGEVGRATSSAVVPGENRAVGLSVVRVKAAGPGTPLQVDGRPAVVGGRELGREGEEERGEVAS